MDEPSDFVVVIHVKACESNPGIVWALNPGGNVVIVDVSGGGTNVWVEDVDDMEANEDIGVGSDVGTMGLHRS